MAKEGYKKLADKHMRFLIDGLWDVTNVQLSSGKTEIYVVLKTSNPDRKFIKLQFKLNDLLMSYYLGESFGFQKKLGKKDIAELKQVIKYIKGELRDIWITGVDENEGRISFVDGYDEKNVLSVRDIVDTYIALREIGATQYFETGSKKGGQFGA